MRSTTAPGLLRALLLGTLGLSLEACSGNTVEDSGTELESDGQSPLPGACTNPMPLVAGIDTGIYRCAEGYLHRAEARECPSRLPRDVVIALPSDAGAEGDGGLVVDECSRDTDCGENAFCTLVTSPSGYCSSLIGPRRITTSRRCIQGCRVDADCGPAAVCSCGPDIGQCLPVSAAAGCHTDADCNGAQCLANAMGPTAMPDYRDAAFACQLPGDACNTHSDCGSDRSCVMSESGRSCQQRAVCGRPFLVQHEPRLACLANTGTWLDTASTAFDLPMDVTLTARLADHWMQIGLMEHASVAAFARFTLDLLAIGAPAELVGASTRAQADEIRHATLAFELATTYGGAPVGPGPLDLSGALTGRTLEEVLRTTIQEGCIGETRAALEAAEAARHATVPHVKAALEGISEDESAHAALAWRVVQWILHAHPELAPAARHEFSQAARTSPRPPFSPSDMPDPAALAHGLLGAAAVAEIHRTVTDDVVLPCARALLGADGRATLRADALAA